MSTVEVFVPRESVNDDSVIIADWLVSMGDKVQKGQPIANIETSKAVIELSAEAGGYIEILNPAKAEVPVGSVIARVTSEPPTSAFSRPSNSEHQKRSEVKTPKSAELAQTPIEESLEQQPTKDHLVPFDAGERNPATIRSLRFSGRAKALINARNIDPTIFGDKGLVKESHVLEFLAKSETLASADSHGSVPEQSSGAENTPSDIAAFEVETEALATNACVNRKIGLLHDIRSSAGERGRSIAWLSANYFWKSWFLRNLVRWVPYGFPQLVHRLRGVRIGKGCFIDPTAIVETAYGEQVVIGNDVRISAGAVIMTHIKAPHLLRDYGLVPLVKKPVVLEDHSFVGVNAVIMPGVTVGKGSVVASGSVVLVDVPQFTMVAGNPAKLVKRFSFRGKLSQKSP